MKKLVFKIAIVIALLIFILVLVLDPLFSKTDTSVFSQTYSEYKATKKDSIDIMIFGSSHAMNSYNPKIIDKALGTFSFNFGLSAQKLKTTDYLIQEFTTEYSPKIVILDLFYFTSLDIKNNKEKSYQLKVFNTTDNSFIKLKHLYHNYSLADIVSVYFPTIRNHDKWTEIKLIDTLDEQLKKDFGYLTRGFLPLKGTLKEKERKKFKDYKSKEYKILDLKSSLEILTKDQRDLIVDIINSLKEKNIKVILVTSPFFNYFYYQPNIKFNSTIHNLSDSLKVDYLDFNKHFKELDLTFNDFKEQSHLNVQGSNKVSAYLAKYISESTSIRAKDENYLKNYLPDIPSKSLNREKSISEIIDSDISKLKINHNFYNNLKAKNALFYSDNIMNNVIIEVSSKSNLNQLKNKAFAIHLYVDDEKVGSLPKEIQNKKIIRIIGKSLIKTLNINNKEYLLLSFKKETDINEFKKLKLFLMDKDKFRGISGEVLELNNIKFY